MSDTLRFIALFFFVVAFTTLNAATPQYENQPVERLEIVIEGRSNESEEAIRGVKSRITTREGGFFTQAQFDNDLKILAIEFDQVEPQLQLINGKMHITLKIRDKPQIRTIRWVGNQHVELSDLRKELGIKPLSTFDRLAFNKAFHKLKAYYVKNGFFEAELSYEVKSDCDTNEVDIEIQINEGRAGHIKKLIFSGFTRQEEEDIIDLMVTKEYSLFFSWYTGEGTYHDEAIQQDQFIILNYLQNEGYADAKVEITVTEASHNMINVQITADRGAVYTVSGIEFTGNTLFCDEVIYNQLELVVGSPYSPEKVRETIGNITDLYGRKGYIDTHVDFEPSLDVQSQTYSVRMVIEEGAQFRVGMIKVFGNSTTQTSIILHESLLVPGEVFNIEKLKLTEKKLINVGYFETVNVYAVKSDGPLGLGEHYRDVHIEVKETSTGHFGAFFGYSTAESLFGGLNITERNFNFQGLGTLSTEGMAGLRGGGEYAHATVQVGLKSRKYVLSWAKPFFRDTPWTVGFDIERSNNRYISNNYEINSTALILHATYKINQFIHFGWHYRIKSSEIHFDDDEKGDKKEKKNHKKKATPAPPTAEMIELSKRNPRIIEEYQQDFKRSKIKEMANGPSPKMIADSQITPTADEIKEEAIAEAARSAGVVLTKEEEARQKSREQKQKDREEGMKQERHDSRIGGLISATGISLTYDSTDHPVTPRSGFKSRGEFELAGLGGDHTFYSFGYTNAYFYPIDKKSVFKLRVDLRFIIPFGHTEPTTIPVDERLFLGGDSLVRGYRPYRLGPLYKGLDNPRGGVSEQFYSLEVTRRLHQKVEVFAFCDGGYLSLHQGKVGSPSWSVGVGARVKLLESIPAVMFGYGFPLNYKHDCDVKRFFISLGGQF